MARRKTSENKPRDRRLVPELETPGRYPVNIGFSKEEMELVEEGARRRNMSRRAYTRYAAARFALSDKARGYPNE